MARDPKEKPQAKRVLKVREDAQQQILERRKNRGTGEQADWGTVDAGLLLCVVTTVTGEGFAIQFGYTLDGSAYRIRLVGAGEVSDEYVRPTEDIDVHLRQLLSDFGVQY